MNSQQLRDWVTVPCPALPDVQCSLNEVMGGWA
jgi:hypothetical protein